MAALVLAEHNNAALDGATAKTVTAASRLADSVHVLVAGSNCGTAAEQAAKLKGVEKVLVADDPRYATFLAEPVAELILAQANAYDALLAPATANGKNVMPRVRADRRGSKPSPRRAIPSSRALWAKVSRARSDPI